MQYSHYIATIAELAESEGVFTTMQAARLGVPRDALSHAAKSGRLERVCHGAYRLVGSGATNLDELVAIWKLTAPEKFTHERIAVDAWDGVAIGGTTAATILELGDFHLSPYRIFAPRRINSRNTTTRFSVRDIARADVSYLNGLPVTTPVRTIFDLVIDDEDPSLIADTLRDAMQADRHFNLEALHKLLLARYTAAKADKIFTSLLADSGIFGRE